jgi:teichuronic acid biosynthesis glycosyltransferase TuaH
VQLSAGRVFRPSGLITIYGERVGTIFSAALINMKIETPAALDKTLAGQNILFLSLPKFDGPYTSTPWQIAVQLASNNKVFFVDHPYTITDLITGFFKNNILKRIKGWFGKGTVEKQNVEVILAPFVFPINSLSKGSLYNYLLDMNHRMMARSINKVLKKHNVKSLIYVNSFNFYFPDLHKYLDAQKQLNVYHCIDPMVKSFTLKHGLYLQKKAARESDLIICTAPALVKQFHTDYPKALLVPNAANFELFNRSTYENNAHPKVEDISGKVIGYLGNIERRTDFALLKKVLDILPDWQLVLAGPVERQYVPVEIFEHDRIHLIGPVPHSEAPSVVKRFDVAIIPFKCDDVSSGIYPLKLFEYMAAGKPVVSTNFNPEVLGELTEVVHTADNEEQFADFVLLAYATDSAQKREKRIFVASQNTWEKRAQLFSSYLLRELESKHQPAYVAERKNQKQPEA